MSSNSISLDHYISVNTSTIGSAVNGVTLAGMLLTDNEQIPFDITGGMVQQFFNIAEVQDYFGTSSAEATYAQNYFASYDNNLNIPPYIYFARYVYDDAIAPYIRTAPFTDLAGMLTSLQAITTGSITFVFNGSNVPLTGLDFSSDTSLSEVATTLNTALEAALTSAASVTFQNLSGSTGPIGSFTASNGLVTGSDTVGYCATGTLATLLGFTEATGAILSQGSLALTPDENMPLILDITTDWSTFLHLFDTSEEADYTTDLAFASWVTTTNAKYQYILWTEESNLEISGNTDNIITPLEALNPNGVSVVFSEPDVACFLSGIGASINFEGTNTTLSPAYKSQSGLSPTVTTTAAAQALEEKSVNYYGKVSNSANTWNIFYNGVMFGALNYIENAWNQRWLANAIGNACMELMTTVLKEPYNDAGYAQLKNAIVTGPIRESQRNGIIQAGNNFTSAQIAQLIQEAGIDISPNLTKSGYYVQVVPATAQQRIDRDPIVTNTWYSNGGAIFKITNNLVFVQ